MGIRGFPGGSVVKKLPANAGDMVSIPSPGRSHPLQSNSAHAQPLSRCSRARELQLLSPCAAAAEHHAPSSLHSTTREATAMRSGCTARVAPTCRNEREACAATKTQHSQNN